MSEERRQRSRREKERERKSWRVPLAGLAGFALGAATVLLIVGLYRRGAPPAGSTGYSTNPPAASVRPAQPQDPAQTQPQTSETAPTPPLPGAEPPPRQAQAPAAGLPADLGQRHLLVPVAGVASSALQDTFADARGSGRIHDAIDIMAPRNTPVIAVEAGRIVKLFTSERGGLTVYQFDPTESYCYYYAHLDRYAPGLREGMPVVRGQLIGYVGVTGNSAPDGPHLHFAINRLKADKKWWQGEPLNPYPVLRQGP